MQRPVAGTVIRGSMPLRFGADADEALRAGRELTSPIAADDTAAVRRGQELYGIYCTICHDPGGGGKGEAVLRGMTAPPMLTASRAKAMADGEMFHILTYGQGKMVSYAAQLSREERWKVIQYVRKMQEAK